MRKTNKATRGLGIALLLGIIVSVGFAAEESRRGQGGPGGGQRRQGDPRQRGERGGFDREAMQERIMAMMQERMGVSNEEWTVIKPRLSKVMKLSMDASGMRGMFGRGRGGRGGDRGQQRPETDAQSSGVQKASADLQETLEKEAPTAAEIKAKLTALRGAREKAKQELVTSQKKLREVLTLKQEAQLVMMGLLD